jgi:acetyltransferase
VADPWQGKGLGPKLLEQVIAIAREQGVRLLWGEVLATNQPMLEMVKRLGFGLTRQPESQTFRVEMALQQ